MKKRRKRRDPLKRAAQAAYEECLDYTFKMDGRTHASIRESIVQYGRMMGLSYDEIADDMAAAGIDSLDIEAALRYA